MIKVLKLSDNEVVLSNSNVEVLILAESVSRLEIQQALNLRKIISLSPKLIIGPKERKVDLPALTYAPLLNEIISYGQLEFTTMFRLYNGSRFEDVPCALICAKKDETQIPYLTVTEDDDKSELPLLLCNDSEPIKRPKYYSKEQASVRTVREANIGNYIANAINNPDMVEEPHKKVSKTYVLN